MYKYSHLGACTFAQKYTTRTPTYTLLRTLKKVTTEEEGGSNFTSAGVHRDDLGGRRVA